MWYHSVSVICLFEQFIKITSDKSNFLMKQNTLATFDSLKIIYLYEPFVHESDFTCHVICLFFISKTQEVLSPFHYFAIHSLFIFSTFSSDCKLTFNIQLHHWKKDWILVCELLKFGSQTFFISKQFTAISLFLFALCNMVKHLPFNAPKQPHTSHHDKSTFWHLY